MLEGMHGIGQFRSEKSMASDVMPRAKPVLVYLVTEDWYFLSHRLPMACAALRAGYEVHVATNVVDGGEAIKSHGFTLHPLNWRRGSARPHDLIRILGEIRTLYRQLKPDIVHHVGVQPAIIGALASIGLPIVKLHAMAGLGFAFTSRTARARATGFAMRLLMRALLNRPRNAVLVQNPDDRAAVMALGIDADRIFLIPGSGVDTEQLTPMPEPADVMTVGYVGRLLADKGVRSLVEAHALLLARGRVIRFVLAGEPDPANPASIPQSEIESWKQIPGLDVLGHIGDIRQVWAISHIAVLPSRREGLPKSLLEAAACGRPIVATDVPGCREIARANVNALLVPADNATALADAIDQLASDAGLRQRFGAAGRTMAEAEFSEHRIGAEIVALYGKLLDRGAKPV
jgi:glycosyltransferase involved in cell wall biosynthesis